MSEFDCFRSGNATVGEVVAQEEMSILNGSRKNSGKNHVITDGRTVRMEDFLRNKSGKINFALPSLRNWIFDILVGTSIVHLTPGNEDHYLSAVLHATIAKTLHRREKELIEKAFEILTEALEEDTVMQHCRMFGYRGDELLSVTRFYTTYRLFSRMKEITVRDNLLRERMVRQTDGEVIYLEAGGKIKACSPQKILASEVHSILPEKRYLPVGFEVNKKNAKIAWNAINQLIRKNNGDLSDENNSYRQGQDIEGHYVTISSEDALEIFKNAYSVIEPKDDGSCNEYKEMESVFLFSLSERMERGKDDIALIVRRGRKLGKMKRNGMMYQDAPDDGNNEGAIAKVLRSKMPVLVLTEQTNSEWGRTFWWPVYYTPDTMNIGLYSEERAKTGIYENVMNAIPFPLYISDYHVIDHIGINEDLVLCLEKTVKNVLEYYTTDFHLKNSFTTDVKRKRIECPIYIDAQEVFSTNDGLVAYIKKVKKNIMNVLERIEDTEALIESMFDYLDMLVEKNADDEKREYIMEAIEKLSISKNQKQSMKGLINEADEIAKNVGETFGLFTILGSGRCEIHLNYDAIEKYCKENGYSDKSIGLFMKYVVSHEMFHAIHYADIMTESGRWMYTRKDYHKQCAVKETFQGIK